MSAAVTVEGAFKAYGNHSVLSGVSLSVEKGEIVAVLGASGSGKTTLLRLIAGFERLDQGRIHIGERCVDDALRPLPPYRRGIGYVPQDASLFPHMSVLGNVEYGLPRGERKKGQGETLLTLVGLDGLGGRMPHQLSGGQQQRVALARALAISPPLVILDEPLSALDAALRSSVRDTVCGALAAEGVAAIWVTHDQDEALSLAHRVAVLRDGVIAQVDTPQELYEHPLDPQMAEFLGDANVLAGKMDGDHVVTALGRIAVSHHEGWGETVRVLVRPENVCLADAPQGIQAQVIGIEYYGHNTMVTLLCGDNDAAITVRMRTTGSLVAARGDMLRIAAHRISAIFESGE